MDAVSIIGNHLVVACLLFLKHRYVVIRYGHLHVWHSAVTQFESVPIEDLVQDMGFGETLVDYLKEFPTNVFSYIGSVRRVIIILMRSDPSVCPSQ